jgi:hypothetical protein
MAITSKALPATDAESIFTSSGVGQGDAVTTMYFCNRDTSARTFNLWLVQDGGSAGPNNIAYSNKVITAGDTYIIDWEKLVLGPGDSIQANSNVANAIVASVSTIGV